MATFPSLQILPFQEALAHYLEQHEPEVWAWFASAETQQTQAETIKLELLKNTYRLDPTSHAELYQAVEEVKAQLGLPIPVTVYQAQAHGQLNASLYFLPGEGQIVLQGDLLPLLTAGELRGVLAHELAHYILWSQHGRRYYIADRIITAMAHDARAEPSQVESARLFRLYTEIFADRGTLQVTGDAATVVSGLIKIQMGVSQVDPASYIQQAEEIFARSKARTEELSHPETFIRTRAAVLWAKSDPATEAEITRMIEGETTLDKLDLVGQQKLTELTRRWLRLFLSDARFQTEPVLGHARLIFPEFAFPAADYSDPDLLDQLRPLGLSFRDYFCYLLLDFCAVDPELELEPVRSGFALTHDLKWDDRLEALLVKELKMKKRELKELRAKEPELLGGNVAENGVEDE